MPNEVSFDHLIALKDEISSMKEVVIKSDAKMDVFIATQKAHEHKISSLEDRVGAVEVSVADLKARRTSDFRVLSVLGFVLTIAAGGITTIVHAIGWQAIKDLIKL